MSVTQQSLGNYLCDPFRAASQVHQDRYNLLKVQQKDNQVSVIYKEAEGTQIDRAINGVFDSHVGARGAINETSVDQPESYSIRFNACLRAFQARASKR
jgi:hypothetical protein